MPRVKAFGEGSSAKPLFRAPRCKACGESMILAPGGWSCVECPEPVRRPFGSAAVVDPPEHEESRRDRDERIIDDVMDNPWSSATEVSGRVGVSKETVALVVGGYKRVQKRRGASKNARTRYAEVGLDVPDYMRPAVSYENGVSRRKRSRGVVTSFLERCSVATVGVIEEELVRHGVGRSTSATRELLNRMAKEGLILKLGTGGLRQYGPVKR